MKIAYEKMNTVIEVYSDIVCSLVVEESDFLFQLLTDLKRTMEGEERGIVVSENDKPISAQKSVSVVTDFVGFTLNQKPLLSKIVGELDKTAKNESNYENSQRVITQIERYILELTLQFPCELFCEKLTVQNLLKCAGVSIVDDYETLEERLLAYMDLERDFEDKKMFIFVNLRCLIPEGRFKRMIDTALAREHRILLIDNMEYPKLEREKRHVIDADLCEI